MKRPATYELRKQIDPNDPVVVAYEKHQKEQHAELIEKTREASKRINRPTTPVKLNKINVESLKSIFVKVWRELHGIDFDFNLNNKQSKLLLYTLMYYFTSNDRFYNSPLLFSDNTNPDLSKGLLIIGPYGVGKTKMMKTFQHMFFGGVGMEENQIIMDESGKPEFLYKYKLNFSSYTANGTVIAYESCKSDNTSSEKLNKDDFWNKMLSSTIYVDDLLTENEASNFGKVNLFSKILHERYENKKITYLTCNYNKNFPLDKEEALLQFSEKYGTHIYDRLFEMFNIIFLTGKSNRK